MLPRCMIPKCEAADYHSRGLCNNHRTQACTLIRAGKTTWEELEDLKLAAPITKLSGCRKPHNRGPAPGSVGGELARRRKTKE